MQEQMEVTEDVGKEHPEKEKIHDPSDSETHQEIAAPATADHVEDQPQSAFKGSNVCFASTYFLNDSKTLISLSQF